LLGVEVGSGWEEVVSKVIEEVMVNEIEVAKVVKIDRVGLCEEELVTTNCGW